MWKKDQNTKLQVSSNPNFVKKENMENMGKGLEEIHKDFNSDGSLNFLFYISQHLNFL